MTDSLNGKRFFKEGDFVAHKENPELKMEVRRIIRSKKRYKREGDKERIFTLGIECGWWVGKELHKDVFHTNSLIPWDVVEQGYIAVLRYIDARLGITT